MTHQSSLLLLPCSQRKRVTPGRIPALDRYDGPQFQVVRKFLRAHPELQTSLDVVVLSARFGIISSAEHIPYYDQRMTLERAVEIRTHAPIVLSHYLQHKICQRFCISLSRDYLLAIAGIEAIIPATCEVTYIRESLGVRLSRLRQWLYAGQPTPRKQPTAASRRARIRGIEINLSPEQVLAQARCALASQPVWLSQPHVWYIEVDGQKVGLKWLVSQISGLPVNAFNTTDARRVLETLGVKVSAYERQSHS